MSNYMFTEDVSSYEAPNAFVSLTNEEVIAELDKLILACDNFDYGTTEGLTSFAMSTLKSIYQAINRVVINVRETFVQMDKSEFKNFYDGNQLKIKDCQEVSNKWNNKLVPCATGVKRDYETLSVLIEKSFDELAMKSVCRTVIEDVTGVFNAIASRGDFANQQRSYAALVRENQAISKNYVRRIKESYDSKVTFRSKTSAPYDRLFRKNNELVSVTNRAKGWSDNVRQADDVRKVLEVLDRTVDKAIDRIVSENTSVKASDVKFVARFIRATAVRFEHYGFCTREAMKMDRALIELYRMMIKEL